MRWGKRALGQWAHHPLEWHWGRLSTTGPLAPRSFLLIPPDRSLPASLFPFKEMRVENTPVSWTPAAACDQLGPRAELQASSYWNLRLLLSSPASSAEAWHSAFLFFSQDTCICLTCTCLLKKSLLPCFLTSLGFLLSAHFPRSQLELGGGAAISSPATSCIPAQ